MQAIQFVCFSCQPASLPACLPACLPYPSACLCPESGLGVQLRHARQRAQAGVCAWSSSLPASGVQGPLYCMLLLQGSAAPSH